MPHHRRRHATYAQTQALSVRIAAALLASGVGAGTSVAILSANDPVAFTSVFGISRAGAVWCPINPRNEAAENRELLELFDCRVLVFQAAFAPLVAAIRDELPGSHMGVPRRRRRRGRAGLGRVPRPRRRRRRPERSPRADDVAMIVGTGGTTGRPKGVMLTQHNLETMTALTLMSYPFDGRPTYLALAPLTHAAGVLCFPVLALGGHIVVMRAPDVGAFLALIEQHAVTHTFLPPTLIYMVLDTSGSTRRICVAAVLLVRRRADVGDPARGGAGPDRPDGAAVRADRGADDDLDDEPGRSPPPGRPIATERLASAGRPTPLVQVAIMTDAGALLGAGERGEIVVRSSLVMAGYYRNPEATAEASQHGWHHTGDIGYLDDDGFLFIVDRAKDMIITGGFNVYSTEVEQALLAHPDVQDCAVFGLPDEKWGERVAAVVQARAGATVDPAELIAFVKPRIGSVKAPKQIDVWPDLPRSKVGKILKNEVKQRLGTH